MPSFKSVAPPDSRACLYKSTKRICDRYQNIVGWPKALLTYCSQSAYCASETCREITTMVPIQSDSTCSLITVRQNRRSLTKVLSPRVQNRCHDRVSCGSHSKYMPTKAVLILVKNPNDAFQLARYK